MPSTHKPQLLVGAALIAALLAGCAAPANTPGAGIGANYTPVIDTQGADMGRYNTDLNECRGYANAVNAGQAGLQGAVGGALAGALITSIYGGRGRAYDQNATYGAFAGLSAAEGAALANQKRIIINCMVGRGYRALDAAVPVMPTAPQATRTVAAQPSPSPYAQDRPVAYAAPGQQVASISPAGPVDAGRGLGVVDPLPPKEPDVGNDSYIAQKLAQNQRCAVQANPKLVSKVPGVEVFSVPCDNGDVLAIRCEFGNCRALR